eukprot:UN08346
MDKLITTPDGQHIITNDGATIVSKLETSHPAAKMIIELSRAQDTEAGDGTTSVVVMAGAILSAAEQLLEHGVHPSLISHSFEMAQKKLKKF